MKSKAKLLLLEDVDGLGRSGDVATAKAGFIRNYLLPKKKAVIADKETLKMQARLKEEREKQAVIDRRAAEEMASRLVDFVLTTSVKVDPEGKLYGSVNALDIANLMSEKGFSLERRNVLLPQAIKSTGSHKINLRLKEGILASIVLEIKAEEF